MPYKHFMVRCADAGVGEGELNAFVFSHPVVHVRGEFVSAGLESFWAYQVEYAVGHSGRPGPGNGKTPPIDYNEKLSPDDFTKYLELRELRKELAEKEAIPPFAIFTNAQLAEMVESRCRSLESLGGISVVGASRKGKYGEHFLALLRDDEEISTDQPD